MKTIRIVTVLAVLAAGLPGLSTVLRAQGPGPASAMPAPVVVELFTSQGCYSCPPADAFLGELAGRDGVLALSMHIDYWNGLGWKDPYSSAEVTARQRAYAESLSGRYVYTPQAVVAGRAHAVGSRRAEVESLIDKARAAQGTGPALSLRPASPGKLSVRIGEGDARGPAAIWLIAFDDRHTTEIPRGENAGKSLTYHHVVRSLRRIGEWTGDARELTVDIGAEAKAGYGNCAVLVQDGGTGPIRAAASLPMAAFR